MALSRSLPANPTCYDFFADATTVAGAAVNRAARARETKKVGKIEKGS